MAEQFSKEEGRKWKAPFFTIWGGQALSLLGSQIVSFGLIWYLTKETGSATVLATASLVAFLPPVIFGPMIGSLVDRWNRKTIMLVADSAIALATVVLAVLFATGDIEIWHIYVISFLRSIGGTFHRPAMDSSTSLMVPKENMTRIQGVNQLLNGGLNIISAPLGALALEVMPIQSILAIDVGTALFAIIPLLFVAVPQPERIISGKAKETSVWQDTKAGFRYVAAWPGMLIIMGMAMVINLVLNPASALMPLLVSDHFGGGALQLGWLEASFGIGVIGGAIALSSWGGFKKSVVTSMAGLIGIGIGFSVMGFAPASAFPYALGGAILAGLSLPLTNGGVGAILQKAVEPEMQGRVMSLLGSGAGAMTPLGLAVAGPLADTLGIQFFFWLSGITCLLMGIVGFMIPQVMNIEEDRAKYVSGEKLDEVQAAASIEGAA